MSVSGILLSGLLFKMIVVKCWASHFILSFGCQVTSYKHYVSAPFYIILELPIDPIRCPPALGTLLYIGVVKGGRGGDRPRTFTSGGGTMFSPPLFHSTKKNLTVFPMHLNMKRALCLPSYSYSSPEGIDVL